MKNPFISILFILLNNYIIAQLPYSQPLYSYDSIVNVVYSIETSYLGENDTLELDIYKPIKDSNCSRPILVIAHGGTWISGSKEDVNTVYISRFFAKRGWVVANINWRLGTHKASNYNMYALCNTSISQPCAYIADSSEIYRANYRGMQDMKDAIRFMKDRSVMDSSDINNVFVFGESAGGFVAIATALTDQVSEKPLSCYNIQDAPTPSSNLNPYNCNPSPINLQRPDLGSIEGNFNLGNNDASVKGVGSFYAGIFDFSILNQLIDTPVFYFYHQGSDILVNYNYGRLLGRITWECYQQSNICQPYYFYPYAFGSKSIINFFNTLGASSPIYHGDIVQNYNYMNDCFANGHSIDNISLRSQSMADLFATRISLSSNDPNSNCSNLGISNNELIISLKPNPVEKTLNIKGVTKQMEYSIVNNLGQSIGKGSVNSNDPKIDVNLLLPGKYFLVIKGLNPPLPFIKM